MTFQRILVPLDGSATSLVGLDKAAELAHALGARLFLLHVTSPNPLTAPICSSALTSLPR